MVGGAANASDCKSDGHWPSGVQVPHHPPHKEIPAWVAQLAEHVFGKDEVSSANLLSGSLNLWQKNHL